MTTRSRSSGIRRQASLVKVSTFLLALILLMVGLATAIPRPQGTPTRGLARRLNIGKSHALLIGNQSYEHLTPLETPVADVRALARVLEDLYEFEVDLLLDADRAQMVDAFDSYVERLEESDRLLIYYAGHGHQDEATGEGYWLPVTARGNRRSEWVANNTVRDTLKAVQARHVLVVADSCFAGTLTRQAAVGLPVGVTMDRYFEKLSNQKSRTALTSGGLEPVDDAGGGGHSVFAGALIETLEGSDSPILEASKLFLEIKRPVMLGSSGIQQPLYADIRQTGHQDGEFLFFRGPGGAGGAGSGPDQPTARVETPSPAQAAERPIEAVVDEIPGKSTPPSKGSYDEPSTGSTAPSKGGYEDEPYTGEPAPSKGSYADPEVSGTESQELAPAPSEVLQVVQTSELLRENWWRWEIHLDGPVWALDEVRRVVYHLHPTFNPPSVEVTARQNRFQLSREGWGVFAVRVQIDYWDGTTETRRHQLEFR